MACWHKAQQGPFPLPVTASLSITRGAGVWLCPGHIHPCTPLFPQSHRKRAGLWSRHLCELEKPGEGQVLAGAPPQGPLHLGQCASGGQTSSGGGEEAHASRQSTTSGQQEGHAVYSLLAPVSTCHEQRAIPAGGQSLMCTHSAAVTRVLGTVALFT